MILALIPYTNDFYEKKEMGLGIGGSITKTGNITLVFPNIKEISGVAGNLFQNSDFANDMWKDLKLNIKTN